ncbi:MAG: DUF2286 domain-containing protein [Crenarchaeota archaeon]|nr:DUF2286 domain-containing protein [Thermoproteota archaeon]
MRILIIRSENGNIVETVIVEGDLSVVLKDVVRKVLEMWEPTKSDLVVMRHNHDISVKLPITPQQFESYSKFNLRRTGNMATFTIPVYVISYENEWTEDGNLRDTKVFLVAPYVDDVVKSSVEELAKEITSGGEE